MNVNATVLDAVWTLVEELAWQCGAPDPVAVMKEVRSEYLDEFVGAKSAERIAERVRELSHP